jgi:transposase
VPPSNAVEGENRSQATLLPEYPEDYIAQDNPVRAVDAFVEELDLKALGFEGADPAVTGCPSEIDPKRKIMTRRPWWKRR